MDASSSLLPALSDPRQPGHAQDTGATAFAPAPGRMIVNGDAARGRSGSRQPSPPSHDDKMQHHSLHHHESSVATARPSAYSASLRGPAFGVEGATLRGGSQSPRHLAQVPVSAGNSQESGATATTSSSDGADSVFSPPASEANGRAPGAGAVVESSQESQLLSQAAAAARHDDDNDAPGLPRKRMADGLVKHGRSRSAASFAGGHSRNTSTVSVASTSGSRIGDLSSELKARLSYAMVKVSHGWHAHSIDQVETLASQAASPASSTSTVHLRHGSSASPQLSASSIPAGSSTNHSAPTTATSQHFPRPPPLHSPSSPPKHQNSLAPPVSIQPSQNPRRNHHPDASRHVAPPLVSSHSHPGASFSPPSAAPRTPGHPSPYPSADQRTPAADPLFFSPRPTPQQAVREQDAMEALLFMSSPGNSASLQHTFASSQPLPSAASSRAAPQRTALPGSQPRKSLPSGRPDTNTQAAKRVGFERTPAAALATEMDVDEAAWNSPRRRPNGDYPLSSKFAPSAGLTAPGRRRPALAEEDIERMLDRAADDGSSDSEGEIQIPVRGAPVEA